MLFPSSIQNSVKLKTIFITPSKQNIVSVRFARAASQKHIQWLLSTKKKNKHLRQTEFREATATHLGKCKSVL